MMRPIKFRAFDKDVGEWFYSDKEYDDHFFEFNRGALICFGIGEGAGSMYEPPSAESYECEPVEQFTGLSDKNGVEIYEGDVVGRNNYIEIGAVVYEDSCFIVDRPTGHQNEYIEWPTEFFVDCEVIGNIYENSDLLKG